MAADKPRPLLQNSLAMADKLSLADVANKFASQLPRICVKYMLKVAK